MPSNSFRLCIPQPPPTPHSFPSYVLSLSFSFSSCLAHLFSVSHQFPVNPKTHLGAILVPTTLKKKKKRSTLKKNTLFVDLCSQIIFMVWFKPYTVN